MSIEITHYKRPHGHPETLVCTNIYAEDEAWFKLRNVKISAEEAPGLGFVCYADIGLTDEDGTPIEAIEISGRRSCQSTLAALRQQCERMLTDNQGELK